MLFGKWQEELSLCPGRLLITIPLLLSDKVKKVMKVCGNEVEHMLALENTACRSLDERMNFACSQVLRKKEYKSLWRQLI